MVQPVMAASSGFRRAAGGAAARPPGSWLQLAPGMTASACRSEFSPRAGAVGLAVAPQAGTGPVGRRPCLPPTPVRAATLAASGSRRWVDSLNPPGRRALVACGRF